MRCGGAAGAAGEGLCPVPWGCAPHSSRPQDQRKPDSEPSVCASVWRPVVTVAAQYGCQALLLVGVVAGAPAVSFVSRVFSIQWLPQNAGLKWPGFGGWVRLGFPAPDPDRWGTDGPRAPLRAAGGGGVAARFPRAVTPRMVHAHAHIY